MHHETESQLDADAQRVRARSRSFWVEPSLVVLVGTVVAFFRLGTAALGGRIWAEDGPVFLQQAYSMGAVRAIFEPYAGYLSVGSRLVTAAVHGFPLTWQGVAIHLVAAAVVAGVAAFAYVQFSTITPSRILRAGLALYIIAVPVGPEVTGNVANLQWFLVFGGGVAAVLTPRTTAATVAGGALLLLATTSSPFGFILVAAVTLHLCLARNRKMLCLTIVTWVGFGVQTVVMFTAAEAGRPVLPSHQYSPEILARGYLSRVLGDGILGVGRYPLAIQPSIRIGFCVFVVIVISCLCLIRRATIQSFGVVASFLALSFVTYVTPVAIGNSPVENPFANSRYYVTPVLFLLAAVLTLASLNVRAITQNRSSSRTWVGGTAAAVLLACGAYALVTSYPTAYFNSRDQGPTWAQAVHTAALSCAGKPNSTAIAVPTQPEGWTTVLTCGAVEER